LGVLAPGASAAGRAKADAKAKALAAKALAKATADARGRGQDGSIYAQCTQLSSLVLPFKSEVLRTIRNPPKNKAQKGGKY